MLTKEFNLLTEYKTIRELVTNFKEAFRFVIPTYDDQTLEDRVRDEVLHLMALAEEHGVKANLWKNERKNSYMISFEK